MDKAQLRELITHVLKKYDLHSDNAVELLMLTAAVESNLGHYIKQVGGGPALGIFQCEPATLDWTREKVEQKRIKCRQEYLLLCTKFGIVDIYPMLAIVKHRHGREIIDSRQYNDQKKWKNINEDVDSFCDIEYKGWAERYIMNLEAQILSARLVYYFKTSKAIPNYKDIKGLAEYWKKYYNSYLGAGTIEGAIEKYNKYVK